MGYILKGTGFFGANPFNLSLVADDFVFRGPEVGPYTGKDLDAWMQVHGVYQGFPDMQPGIETCWFDPKVERLVYCVLYYSGTFTKPWHTPMGVLQPNNKRVESSGEVWSVLWDSAGKVRHHSVGYGINAHRGQECGFGAIFGLTCFGKGGSKLTYNEMVAGYISQWTLGIPKARSDKVPDWWNEFCETNQCP